MCLYLSGFLEVQRGEKREAACLHRVLEDPTVLSPKSTLLEILFCMFNVSAEISDEKIKLGHWGSGVYAALPSEDFV